MRRGQRTSPSELTLSVSARQSPYGVFALLILMVVAAATPWFFGSVQARFQVWIALAILAALVLGWFDLLVSKSKQAPLPTAAAVLVLGFVLGLLQLTSLPSSIHTRLAPRSAQLWQQLVPDVVPTEETDAVLARLVHDSGQGPAVAQVSDALEESRTIRDAQPRLDKVSLYPLSTRRDLGQLVLAVSAFVLGVLLFRKPAIIRAFLWLIAANGTALAFFGLVQQLTWNGMLFWRVPLTLGGTPFASFVNRNNAAGYLLLCLAAAVGLLVHQVSLSEARLLRNVSSPITRLLAWVASLNAPGLAALTAAGCIIAGIVCSLSRGAWLAMFVAIVVALVTSSVARRARPRWLLLAIIGVVATVMVLWVGGSSPVRRRMATMLNYEDTLANVRLSHWEDGLRAAGDFWMVGSGLGTYRYVYRLYEQTPDDTWFYHAENQYLEALVETGIVGLALLLVLIVLIAAACWRLMETAQTGSLHMLGVVGVFALTGQVVHAFFDFGLYIPANMFLFSLMCGAVAGRAASLTTDLPSDRRSLGTWSLSRWIALRPNSCLTGSLVAVLVCLTALALGDLRRTASSEAFQSRDRLEGPRRELPLGTLRLAVADVVQACEQSPDDAQLHRQAANLFLDMYSVERLTQLREQRANRDSLQTLRMESSPTYIHSLTGQFARDNRTVDLEDLRNDPLVQRYLTPAVRHLLRARDACPLLDDVHVRLAELCGLVVDPTTDQVHLARARRVGGAEPRVYFHLGLMHVEAGRLDAAFADWRRCLELSPSHMASILDVAATYADLQAPDRLDALIPDCPETMLRVARDHLAGEEFSQARRQLLQRAQQLLTQMDIDAEERCYLTGCVLAAENQPLQAMKHVAQAVQLRPEKTAWRYELAMLMHRRGMDDEAREQAKLCVRLEPDNKQYESLLRQLIRTQLTDSKSTTPGAPDRQ